MDSGSNYLKSLWSWASLLTLLHLDLLGLQVPLELDNPGVGLPVRSHTAAYLLITRQDDPVDVPSSVKHAHLAHAKLQCLEQLEEDIVNQVSQTALLLQRLQVERARRRKDLLKDRGNLLNAIVFRRVFRCAGSPPREETRVERNHVLEVAVFGGLGG